MQVRKVISIKHLAKSISSGGGGGSSSGGRININVNPITGEIKNEGIYPGVISNNIGVDKNVSYKLLSSLDKNTTEFIKNNKAVEDAIAVKPISLLVVRDHKDEILATKTDKELYDTINKYISDYQVINLCVWNKELGKEVYVKGYYDKYTEQHYLEDLSDIKKNWWVGIYRDDGNIDWYYYFSAGKYTNGFLYSDHSVYLFNNEGIMLTGDVRIGEEIYKFNDEKGKDEGKLMLDKPW